MHPRVLEKPVWELVRSLVRSSLLEGWTLCDGTGLALQFGHRTCEDLVFFRSNDFEVDELLMQLSESGRIEVTSRGRNTLHCFKNGIRLSFLKLEAPLLYQSSPYRGMMIADPGDIAILKIIAIGGRGSRKDFIDLYTYLQHVPGLERLLDQLESRDSSIDWNRYHLLKSMTWFADAEQEPMPEMLVELDWETVKELFRNQVCEVYGGNQDSAIQSRLVSPPGVGKLWIS
ncbi:nucleotidyl transferase AbiEii/AbiGii toxin family protein [Candidatus Zixiibacteriota bacterium]